MPQKGQDFTGCDGGIRCSSACGAVVDFRLASNGNARAICSSGTLVVSTLLTRFPKWQITVALGILSAIVGSMDIMAWFIPFLLFLGIATPPVAGIYIADFFLYRRNGYQESVLAQESQIKVLTFAAWIIGAAVGFMTVKGLFTLTTIPSVDSILRHVSRMHSQSGKSTPLIPGYTQVMITAERRDSATLPLTREPYVHLRRNASCYSSGRQTPEHYHRSRAVSGKVLPPSVTPSKKAEESLGVELFIRKGILY